MALHQGGLAVEDGRTIDGAYPRRISHILELLSAIDSRVAELAAEITVLETAKAALHGPRAIGRSPVGASDAMTARSPGRPRRPRRMPSPTSTEPAASRTSLEPVISVDEDGSTVTPKRSTRKAAAKGTRRRRAGVAVRTETLGRLLTDTSAGLSANVIAERAGAGYNATLKLLHEFPGSRATRTRSQARSRDRCERCVNSGATPTASVRAAQDAALDRADRSHGHSRRYPAVIGPGASRNPTSSKHEADRGLGQDAIARVAEQPRFDVCSEPSSSYAAQLTRDRDAALSRASPTIEERVMTGKADFSEQEWKSVLEAPPSAGLLVLTAQRGGSFRETFAIAKSYAEARQQHGQSELLDEIASAKPAMDHTRYHSPEELRQHGLQHLRDAVSLLEQKATPPRRSTTSDASW